MRRTTLIVGLGIAAAWAGLSVIAGPINPPAGPIASTGHTVDEIFNKIPAVGGFDGRIPIPGGATTVLITQPGSYVLAGNINAGVANGLIISSSDVTLDLNGYRVSTTGIVQNPITLSGALSNITIRNGSTHGGVNGIIVAASVTGLLFEDLRVASASQTGLQMNSGGNLGFLLRRCHIVDTGANTAGSPSLTITGINLVGSTHRVEDCTVSRVQYLGTGTGTLRGIVVTATGAGNQNLLARCCVTSDVPTTGTGIIFQFAGIYRDNTVMQFSAPYSIAGSTNGGGNFP